MATLNRRADFQFPPALTANVDHAAIHGQTFSLAVVVASIRQAHPLDTDLLSAVFHLPKQSFPVLLHLSPNATGGNKSLANPLKDRLTLLVGQQAT
jgi:hypothetical protein